MNLANKYKENVKFTSQIIMNYKIKDIDKLVNFYENIINQVETFLVSKEGKISFSTFVEDR